MAVDLSHAEDEVEYEDMTPAELKAECKDRGLKTAGKKAVLIARLENDDEAAEDPFGENTPEGKALREREQRRREEWTPPDWAEDFTGEVLDLKDHVDELANDYQLCERVFMGAQEAFSAGLQLGYEDAHAKV